MITLPGNVARFVARQREQADKQREALGIEARSWYRITNAADSDEAEVMLYDEIGGWWGYTADQFISELRQITAPKMRVRINSPGGSVFEGIAISNALRSHPASVTVQVDGIAASIASVIAMAGDRIEMAPNTMLMIHDASGVCLGNASDMEEMAELLDLISDNIADAYAQRAGGTRDEWRARMRAETWYLPEDAVENGLADEAVQAPKAADPVEPAEEDEPDMARAFDLAAYGYQGPKHEEPEPAPLAHPEMQRFAATVAEMLGEDMAAKIRAIFEDSPQPAVVDTAVAVHHTATVDHAWDGGAQEKKLPAPMPVATAKAMYAWYDPAQVEDGKLPKSAAKFPHHDVDSDGKPGPANLAACRNGLARLTSADIPEAEREGVRKHLQAHLDDANGSEDRTDPEPAVACAVLHTDAQGNAIPCPDAAAPAAERDTWAATVARLTQPQPDPWAAAVARLTHSTSAASSATEAA